MNLQAAIRIPWADRRPQKTPRLNELRYGRWPLPEDPLSLQLYHHGNRWAAYQLLSAGHMATPATFTQLPMDVPCLNMLTVRRSVQQNFGSNICFFQQKADVSWGQSVLSVWSQVFPVVQLSNLRTSSIVLVGFSRHCSTHNNSSPEAHLTDLSEQNHKLSQINWHRNGKRNMSIFYSEKYVIFHGYVTLAVWRKGRTQASKSLKIKSWMSVVSSYAWKHLWISDLELTKWYHSAQ